MGGASGALRIILRDRVALPGWPMGMQNWRFVGTYGPKLIATIWLGRLGRLLFGAIGMITLVENIFGTAISRGLSIRQVGDTVGNCFTLS